MKLSRPTKTFTVALYYQLLITELIAVNIALRKKAKYCSPGHLSDIMFDGIKDFDKAEIMEKPCTFKSFIEVDLNGSYDVHYVVVYGGRRVDGTLGKQLDFFKARLEKSDCSSYPGKHLGAGRGMRVNCDSMEKKSSNVQIESRKNEGLFISEIEVHTLASGLAGDWLLIYRGCFSSFGEEENGTLVKDPLDKCRQKCGSQKFCGIKANNQFYCGSDFKEDDEISADECNFRCRDDTKLCGGVEAYSIYLVLVRLPSYIGCFKAKDHPDHGAIRNNMTIEKCLLHCEIYNFAILLEGNVCFCTEFHYLSDVVTFNKCMTSCSGDPESFCGGISHISIYRTCLKPFEKSPVCSKLFKCTGPYDKYGDCGGTCKQGFVGDHCLERTTTLQEVKSTKESTEKASGIMTSTIDLSTSSAYRPIDDISLSTSTYNGITKDYRITENIDKGLRICTEYDPCVNRTNAKCIVHRGKAECQCVVGYTAVENTCADIDECEFEPCDIRYSSCLNTNGSFKCDCKTSYISNRSSDVCLADIHRFPSFGLLEYLNPQTMIALSLCSVLFFTAFLKFFDPMLSSESIPNASVRPSQQSYN